MSYLYTECYQKNLDDSFDNIRLVRRLTMIFKHPISWISDLSSVGSNPTSDTIICLGRLMRTSTASEVGNAGVTPALYTIMFGSSNQDTSPCVEKCRCDSCSEYHIG